MDVFRCRHCLDGTRTLVKIGPDRVAVTRAFDGVLADRDYQIQRSADAMLVSRGGFHLGQGA